MYNTVLQGDWPRTREQMLKRWPHLTASDAVEIGGERNVLIRRLRDRYGKTYGELEREVTEFDMRDIWAANMARPSLGITND